MTDSLHTDRKTPKLVLVAAMAKNHVIGRNNGIPWDLAEDRKHFRNVTLDHAVIMGRATYDSMGKPLPKRRNIVVSRNIALHIPGVDIAPDLDSAIAMARMLDPEPRLIGGGQLYAEGLPQVTRMYLTVLDEAYDGETVFPRFDASEWIEVERRRGEGATYYTLDRRAAISA